MRHDALGPAWRAVLVAYVAATVPALWSYLVGFVVSVPPAALGAAGWLLSLLWVMVSIPLSGALEVAGVLRGLVLVLQQQDEFHIVEKEKPIVNLVRSVPVTQRDTARGNTARGPLSEDTTTEVPTGSQSGSSKTPRSPREKTPRSAREPRVESVPTAPLRGPAAPAVARSLYD